MQSTPPGNPDHAHTSTLSFEEALIGLEEVVARLESGALTLEVTIATFRQGSELAAQCQRIIAGAELRITELAGEPAQGPTARQAANQIADLANS